MSELSDLQAIKDLIEASQLEFPEDTEAQAEVLHHFATLIQIGDAIRSAVRDTMDEWELA